MRISFLEKFLVNKENIQVAFTQNSVAPSLVEIGPVVLEPVSSKGVTYDQPLDTPIDLRQYLVGRKSRFIK